MTGVVVARSADELRPAIAAMAERARGGRRRGRSRRRGDAGREQFGHGYGRPTAAADAATALLARTEGLFVDPIYTAKALASLVASVRSGAAMASGRLLARRRPARPLRAAPGH